MNKSCALTNTNKIKKITTLILSEPSKPVISVVSFMILFANNKWQIRIKQAHIGKQLHMTAKSAYRVITQARKLGYITILEADKEKSIGNSYQINL